MLRFRAVLYLVLSIVVGRAARQAPRHFIPLKTRSLPNNPPTVRVVQYNTLADGLSGKRKDLGRFSRAKKPILDWENRKHGLLQEMLLHDPDIITCQEIDHYHDWFLPKLLRKGYYGLFAPKPISECLQVGDNADGCAIFVKRSKFKILSSETSTLVLPKKARVSHIQEDEDDEDIYIRAQNQVALLVALDFVGEAATRRGEYGKLPPPIIVGTTHLKSSKSGTGERYRQREVRMILDRLDVMRCSYAETHPDAQEPPVIFAGCLNACAEQTSYAPPLCYRTIKKHKLNLRSVYTDDVQQLLPSHLADKNYELFSTWKAKIMPTNLATRTPYGIIGGRGEDLYRESVTKSLIDYILYSCTRKTKLKVDVGMGFVGSYEAAIDIPTEAPNLASMSLIFLLRSILYFTAALIASTSVLLSSLSNDEKVVITGLLGLGLLSFEVTGTFVGPPSTDIVRIGTGDNIKPDIVSGVSGSSSSGGVDGSTDTPGRSSRLGARASTSASGATSNVAYCRGPSLTCVAILDMPSAADIGPMLLPTVAYPSDHITIAADLALIW